MQRELLPTRRLSSIVVRVYKPYFQNYYRITPDAKLRLWHYSDGTARIRCAFVLDAQHLPQRPDIVILTMNGTPPITIAISADDWNAYQQKIFARGF